MLFSNSMHWGELGARWYLGVLKVGSRWNPPPATGMLPSEGPTVTCDCTTRCPWGCDLPSHTEENLK